MTAPGCATRSRARLRLVAFLLSIGLSIGASADRFAAAQVPLDTLTTVERTTEHMEWIGIDPDGGFRFRPFAKGAADATQDVVVPKGRLVAWGRPTEAGTGAYLVLVDGGVIAIADANTDPESIHVRTQTFGARGVPQFGERAFPLERARGVVFRSPSSAPRRDRLFESVLAPAPGDRDRLTLVDGDELVGSLTTLAPDRIVIETSLGPAEKQTFAASTLVLNPALAAKIEPPSQRILIGFVNGTTLAATSIAMTDDLVSIVPAIIAGTPEEKGRPWTAERGDVVFLQVIGGDARYLSDLEPTGYKHVPFLDRVVAYRIDRSVTGGRLRAGGRRFEKGISMPSTSRLTFPLDGKARKFQAEIAIDDDAEGAGSVTFRVFVDAEERYRSEIVRGGDPPRTIDVDIAGGKQLSLVVDFAEFGDQRDHADWLNARLVP